MLLAAMAGLTGMRRVVRTWPARLAELAEDLAQPVVDVLEDRWPVGQVHVLDRGQLLDGRVDARVTGGDGCGTLPFWFHRVRVSSRGGYPIGPCRALPSRVNGTAQRGARRT